MASRAPSQLSHRVNTNQALISSLKTPTLTTRVLGFAEPNLCFSNQSAILMVSERTDGGAIDHRVSGLPRTTIFHSVALQQTNINNRKSLAKHI